MNIQEFLLPLAVAASVAGPAAADDSAATVLEFDTMSGVAAPYTGTANPIREVAGGGLPWVVEIARGELRADGRLEIRVRGLVLADDPAVPAALRLTNPAPEFRAIVSCASVGDTGAAATANVETDTFPATPDGDATIEARIDLPAPCHAPVVFVTNAQRRWFAVTGH